VCVCVGGGGGGAPPKTGFKPNGGPPPPPHADQSGFSNMAGKLREDWKLTLYPSDHWAQHAPFWLPYSNKDGSFAFKALGKLVPQLLEAKQKWRAAYGLVGWTLPTPSSPAAPSDAAPL
jgi:hypothetical protein